MKWFLFIIMEEITNTNIGEIEIKIKNKDLKGILKDRVLNEILEYFPHLTDKQNRAI